MSGGKQEKWKSCSPLIVAINDEQERALFFGGGEIGRRSKHSVLPCTTGTHGETLRESCGEGTTKKIKMENRPAVNRHD